MQESTRASSVVSRVRALFSQEPHVRKTTDMNRLIQALAHGSLRDEAIRRDVSIKLVLANDVPRLEMDTVQIQQVLLNLATNAMDALMLVRSPRELIIRSEKRGDDEILVTVEDHGPGIAPEIHRRCLSRSSAPNGTVRGWALLSVAALSNHTRDVFGPPIPCAVAPYFSSL